MSHPPSSPLPILRLVLPWNLPSPLRQMLPTPCSGESDTDLYSAEFLSLLRVLGPKQSGKWTASGGVGGVDCEETESHVQSCISSANIEEPALHQFPSGLRASWSPLQSWGPSPHTLVQSVQCGVCRARPPAAPPPPHTEQGGWGARPVPQLRTGGTLGKHNCSVSQWLGGHLPWWSLLGPLCSSLSRTVISVALMSGCLCLNLDSATYWTPPSSHLIFPEPQCPRVEGRNICRIVGICRISMEISYVS